MKYQSHPHYLHSPSFLTPSITAVEDSFLASWLPLHELKDKNELFHYTTLEGMQGILTTRSLWLGHVSCLNDRSEIQYGQQIVDAVLRDAIQREASEDIRVLIQDISNWIRLFAQQNVHHVFVVSFCESDNLLSQWRGYSQRGQGYCLGFQFSAATLIASDLTKLSEGKEPYLRKVIYAESAQRELVQGYIDNIIYAVKAVLDSGSLPLQPPRANVGVLAIQAANILMDMVMCFKHKAFESEGEWRLVHVTREDFDPKGVKFRESAGQLIPYRPTYVYDKLEGNTFSFPVRSIRFGPMQEPGRTRSTISLLAGC